MKLAVIALDYDGTIAVDGVFDPSVRGAIGTARQKGIAVVLVTGRRLDDLHRVAGDVSCFDAIVCENGAVLEFPASGRHLTVGHPAAPAFIAELHRRGIQHLAGEVVIETDAASAEAVLDVVRRLQQPLILAFNRGRLMVLPQGVAKSTGLRHALQALRLSIHNTIGIGDAENDHDLLDTCEVGVAVAWGSAALRAVADEVIEGSGPHAVARLHPPRHQAAATLLFANGPAPAAARPSARRRTGRPGGAGPHRPDCGRAGDGQVVTWRG